MFLNDLPFWFEVSKDGLHMVGEAIINDALRFPGSGLPRSSVLATIADCVAGLPACIATAPRLAVTLDIVTRNVAERCGDRLGIAGEIVKIGRSAISGEVRFSEIESKALVATSYLTFMMSPRPQDNVPPMRSGMRTTGSMAIPFPEFLGVRAVAPGVCEINLVPLIMQASQTLQGGVFGVLAEEAARSLTARAVLDLDIRYLNAVRVGPAQAIANLLGENLIRVEVRDRGNDDRLAALVLIRTAPTSRR
jgi:acyl-coenzyme A thioesterase PaaI-like protein